MLNVQKPIRGVTLIELMIVVAIMGILVAVAVPSYSSFVAKSNRSEGQTELVRIANLQEQYFVDNRKYTSDLSDLGLSGTKFTTESGYYEIESTTSNSNINFSLKATAQGSQATRDSSCTELTITDTGQKGATSTTCWVN